MAVKTEGTGHYFTPMYRGQTSSYALFWSKVQERSLFGSKIWDKPLFYTKVERQTTVGTTKYREHANVFVQKCKGQTIILLQNKGDSQIFYSNIAG